MKWLLIILCSLMVIDSSMAMGDPLFIVNGKEVDKSTFESIDPDIIGKITVLKDESSIQEYGTKGSNGVILVTLKCDTAPIFSDDKTFKEYLSENIKWSDKEDLAEVTIKFKVKKDGSTELIAVTHSTDRRFKNRALKTFEESPKWRSPAMNMGEAVEVEKLVYIALPENKRPKSNFMIR